MDDFIKNIPKHESIDKQGFGQIVFFDRPNNSRAFIVAFPSFSMDYLCDAIGKLNNLMKKIKDLDPNIKRINKTIKIKHMESNSVENPLVSFAYWEFKDKNNCIFNKDR